MAAEHIVVVGKGGVGKTTTAANLAAALAEARRRVLVVGYDSGGASTAMLRGARQLKPLQLRDDETSVPLYAAGFNNTLCLELGNVDGRECGRTGTFLEHQVIREYRPEYVLHDLPSDLGNSFAVPAGTEGVPLVLVVTTAEMASIHAMNELFRWLNTVAAAGCRFGGVVLNNLSCALYQTIVSDFVGQTGTSIAGNVPRSLMVSVSDFYNQTLLESAPLSQVSYAYRKLASGLLEPTAVRRPKYLPEQELKRWALKWGEIVSELETGVVREGSSI